MDRESKTICYDVAFFLRALRITVVSLLASTTVMTILVLMTTESQNPFQEVMPYALTINTLVVLSVAFPISCLFLRQRRKLDMAYEKLERMVRFDQLTEALSRRAFFEDIEAILAQPQERDQTNAVAFLDLDHFKKVNDDFGHAVGDEVLRVLGDVFKDQLLRGEIVGRLGGEEFGIFMQDCSPAHARKKMQRLIDDFKKRAEIVSREEVNCTMSVGVAASSTIRNLDTLLSEADELLYRAKQDGRNCVAMAGDQDVAAARAAA